MEDLKIQHNFLIVAKYIHGFTLHVYQWSLTFESSKQQKYISFHYNRLSSKNSVREYTVSL